MTRRALIIRAFIPQLCLALLLCTGLAGGLGLTIIWHRVWVTPPPMSAQVQGPPSANNSGSLQSQIAKGMTGQHD